MNQKNKDQDNCIKSYPKCIQWNLSDIPVLGISNGDYLDEIIFAIANKLCELINPIDLSDLSLQCLIDKLNNQEPQSRTLQTILQLLIDNECTLKDLIDNLQNQIDDISNDNLILDLKCLRQNDTFGNPLPYDQKSVLQQLINEVCSLKDSINFLNIKVVDLQNQIDDIDVTPYTLPIVTTCISPTRRLDLSVNDIATSLCSLKNAVGAESQITTAISRQCSNFNAQFGTISGWINNPVNLAQSYSNLELAFCNVLNRLIAIETTCCAPSCDKVKIGFTYDYDFDNRELTLSFTSGAGTVIPTGFVDCGTEFVFKDCDGNTILTSIQAITNNADLVFIMPMGSCLHSLSVSIKTKFCLEDANNTVILTCRDCITKNIPIQAQCCTLTNNTLDEVILVYETPIIV